MNISVGIKILETLYQNGQITGEALAAIAPIQWLSRNHPELINSEVKIRKAIAITEEKPKTCKSCVNYSSIHKCCMIRIGEGLSYIPVTANSLACIDHEEVSLPYFLQRRRG